MTRTPLFVLRDHEILLTWKSRACQHIIYRQTPLMRVVKGYPESWHIRKILWFSPRLLECPPILPRPRTQFEYVLEILYDERLGYKVHRTEPNRLDGGFDISVLR